MTGPAAQEIANEDEFAEMLVSLLYILRSSGCRPVTVPNQLKKDRTHFSDRKGMMRIHNISSSPSTKRKRTVKKSLPPVTKDIMTLQLYTPPLQSNRDYGLIESKARTKQGIARNFLED